MGNTLVSLFNVSNYVPAWMNNWYTSLNVPAHLLSTETYLPPFLVSIFLGVCLGLERRKRHKVAGVRTNMLVCASACLITMVGLVVFEGTKIGDPARLPGQLLAGIAFLGAGVIWKNGWKTQGITTSAMILFATGIGILCGFGYLLCATMAAFIIVFCMHASYWVFPPDDVGEHILSLRCPTEKFNEARKLFPQDSTIDRFTRTDSDGMMEVRINVKITRRHLDQLIAANAMNPIITSIAVIDESGN